MTIPPAYIATMRATIGSMLDRTGELLKSEPNDAKVGSTAEKDLSANVRPESILTALSIGDIALEHSADHLSAFNKLLDQPIETLACFTCIRSMLETAAIGAWVLAPHLSVHDRIARVFAVRFEGIEQQLKFGNCVGLPTVELQKLEQRISDIENDAVSIGYPMFRNKNNKVYAIGMVMPGATEMIRDVLDDETIYRLLSAVAHGHSWAITQLGFNKPQANPIAVSGGNVHLLEKRVYVDGLALVGLHGVLAFAHLAWNKFKYLGLDSLKMEEILEDTADKLNANVKLRFWRT